MSILDDSPNNIETPAENTAKNLIDSTRRTFLMMKNVFNARSISFWNNPKATSSQIAVALRTDAKEVFELHYTLGQLIDSIKPEATEQGLSLIGQFTINEDGTVTIANSNAQ